MSTSQVNNNLEINVEKFEFEGIDHEPVPYVQVNREVIQNITDPVAGFIWVYLQSLPSTWVVNKAHLMKKFDIGKDKYTKHMTFLRHSNLIAHTQKRNKDGTLGSYRIKVLNGSNFKDASTLNSSSLTGGGKNRSPVEPGTGKYPPLRYNISSDIPDPYKSNITTTTEPITSKEPIQPNQNSGDGSSSLDLTKLQKHGFTDQVGQQLLQLCYSLPHLQSLSNLQAMMNAYADDLDHGRIKNIYKGEVPYFIGILRKGIYVINKQKHNKSYAKTNASSSASHKEFKQQEHISSVSPSRRISDQMKDGCVPMKEMIRRINSTAHNRLQAV